MDLKQLDPMCLPDTDDSTIYEDVAVAATPPESIAADLQDIDDLDPMSEAKSGSSSVPWPGSTFIIRALSTGQVITLLDGQIVLASPGARGSIHWKCVETKGWLGFRNAVSGNYLGHNDKGVLRCRVDKHQGWENFCARLRPEGGYVLLMTHFERLWHIGIKKERGVEMLAKLGDGGSKGIVWEFIEV